MEAKDKNTKNFVVMILILIALIVIIFLLVGNLGFIDHKPRIPTGNVDIFDIIFQNDCNRSCNEDNLADKTIDNEKDLSVNASKNTNEYLGGNEDISSSSEEATGIEVFDEQTEYSQNTQLRIFTNPTYDVVDDKIAPASENSYQFVIRNNNNFNIRYDLDLNEDNKYNINMKYRLKLNGVYVAGNNDKWLTYDELKQQNIELAANTYDVYTLDWKWVEGNNDTEVGTNINSNYKLELKITASGY